MFVHLPRYRRDFGIYHRFCRYTRRWSRDSQDRVRRNNSGSRWRGIFNRNSNVTRPPVHNKRLGNSLLVVSSFLSVEIPRDRSDQPIRFTMYRALCARYKSSQSALRSTHSDVSTIPPLSFCCTLPTLLLLVLSPFPFHTYCSFFHIFSFFARFIVLTSEFLHRVAPKSVSRV